MNQRSLGIEASSTREIGGIVEHSCSLTEAQLKQLLPRLPVGAEVSVTDPTAADCSLEVRRIAAGFEIKRGCHGSYGTWRKATFEEAEAWLLPGIAAASRVARPGYGVLVALPKDAQ